MQQQTGFMATAGTAAGPATDHQALAVVRAMGFLHHVIVDPLARVRTIRINMRSYGITSRNCRKFLGGASILVIGSLSSSA